MTCDLRMLLPLLLLARWAAAQAPPVPLAAPLPTHAVRSISPADVDFADLEFLRAEIGPARAVLLGEPTHGEGNVFEAKVRLIKFLQQRMGFTTLAFESGFYDLRKAQRALEAGASGQEALGNSVFPVWTGTQEFQGVLPLVGRGGLRLAGFDPQLSGDYGGDLVDDLQAFLAPEKGAAAVDYDYLEEVIGFMGEQHGFLPTARLADFEREMGKAQRLLAKPAAPAESAGPRRAEAAFWQQCLRSLLAQARDYAINESGSKEEKDFKAIDSNPRDAQMADNLLWYLRQHPQEKVVCWGALPHFANKVEMLNNEELRTYQPMGRAVKAALGPDAVYILGTLAGGGRHGFPVLGYQAVPPPAAGSLEAALLAQPADYAFVSLKHDAPGQVLTAYALDYQLLTGPWSEVVDGFLFLRSVNPPHGAAPALPGSPDSPDSTPTAAPTALNPAPRRASGTARARASGAIGTRPVTGVVLDQQTGQSVAYASVVLPGQGVGTVADGQGRFVLAVPGANTLQVSSVGYATASVAALAAGAALVVRLVPAAYALAGVQVRGQTLDPRQIMKKVLAAIPANYEQQDYRAEVHTRRRVVSFDTLTYEAEYVSQIFEPAGYRNVLGGFLMLGPQEQHRVQELRVLTQPKRALRLFELMNGAAGFLSATADPVRTSPLFKTSTWRKFALRLDSVVERGGETAYVVGFAARHANHRSTGTYLQAGYSGRFRVRQRDYAVTRYEALWQTDTATNNAVARKHFPRHDGIARLYTSVLSADHTDHVVTYAQAASGRYHVRRSVAQGLSAGRVLRSGQPFYQQKSCEAMFTVLPASAPPPPPNPAMDPRTAGDELHQLNFVEFHPAFWQAYGRPGVSADSPIKPLTPKP